MRRAISRLALATLIEMGVDVNLPLAEFRPDSALWLAATAACRDRERGLETVRWLVAHGARVNFGFKDEPLYCYPLMQAMKNNDLEMVELMVSTGKTSTCLGKFNRTPLSWAIDFGRTKIADYLLEGCVGVASGAGVCSAASSGSHPRSYCRSGRSGPAEWLGADRPGWRFACVGSRGIPR